MSNHGVWDNRGKIRPVYYTFLLFNQFGDRLLKAESDQPLLPAYAALRPDGALSLMIVNKDPCHDLSRDDRSARLQRRRARAGLAARHADAWHAQRLRRPAHTA